MTVAVLPEIFIGNVRPLNGTSAFCQVGNKGWTLIASEIKKDVWVVSIWAPDICPFNPENMAPWHMFGIYDIKRIDTYLYDRAFVRVGDRWKSCRYRCRWLDRIIEAANNEILPYPMYGQPLWEGAKHLEGYFHKTINSEYATDITGITGSAYENIIWDETDLYTTSSPYPSSTLHP